MSDDSTADVEEQQTEEEQKTHTEEESGEGVEGEEEVSFVQLLFRDNLSLTCI